MHPRPYQIEAEDAIFRDWRDVDSTLAVMPTGTGKTVLFGRVVKRWLEENPGRGAIVLAHREELIFQAREELAPILGFTPEVEMGDYRANMNPLYGDVPRCVVASVASICREKRLQKYCPSRWGMVVVDEAHHSIASTYKSVLDHFRKGKQLGVTATPRRGDGLAVGGAFERCSYEYEIADAIRDGYLVDVEQQFVMVKSLDITRVLTTAGDLNEGDLSKAVSGDRTLHEMGTAIYDHCGDEPTLVFTVDINHGIELEQFLNSLKPGSAVTLSGQTPAETRRHQLRRFEAGEFQYLLGCALFTEGFNCPRISRVVMAKLSKSIVYYTQAIGRGTRPLRGVLTPDMDTASIRRAAIKASKKPCVLVLDFVGNSGRHSLVRCTDVLGGRSVDAETLERAKATAAKTGNKENVLDALERAKASIAEDRRREAEIKAKATYHVKDVDPFGKDGSEVSERKVKKSDYAPCGPRLKSWLERNGCFREGMTHGEAAAIGREIERRKRQGLCTMKQARMLAKNGMNSEVPFEVAKAFIDLLSARSWKRPDYEITRERLSIRAEGGGHRLVIEDSQRGKVAVGPVLGSPSECRRVYGSLIGQTTNAA